MKLVIKLKQHKLKSQKLFFLLSIVSLLFFSSCHTADDAARSESRTEEEQSPPDQTVASFDVPASDINLAKPLQISTEPKDAALCEQINRTIEQSEYANARWGVFVLSLKDGRIACARDGRQLFNPASIQKVLTSIVALDKLGADFRFKTSVFAPVQIDADGTLNGDLTVYGTGAPDFNAEAMDNLISQLQAKGLKRVRGNIVGDDSYFKGINIGDGWTWNELQWHYGAEASALSFKENVAGVYMDTDGKPAASSDLMEIRGEVKPTENGQTPAFGVQRGLESNEVYVWGNGKKAYGKLSVHDPALFTARNFKKSLENKEIAVEGEVKSVGWRTENRPEVTNTNELAAVESKPLGELIQRFNKHSVNLYGELILRAIGKKFGDTAPDESREIQEIRGDDAAGAAVVKKFLRENNVAVEDLQIHDGSGLSRLDFVSPEAFARALVYAAKSNFADAFINSLPIAGVDGTLGGRLWNVKGRILAKTGTITFVNSLAGYAQADDETFAFAIIANNITRKTGGVRIVDKIAQSIVKQEIDKEKSE
ncbi:MAG: D-alanyl-D-alanine carboxypeptidase/D-alanyl-D-alanine-endopeptidase [Acidobacteriota bacterium]|nr:D-alanyl-D-alanine carboxypeptidase/D-alanyl-D-alanine-endopeptidase [Acidobacteriota bacterium]